jgi:predicted nucleic acid-binding protein
MTKLLDANLIIRHFLDDDHAKADAVEQLLASGEGLWLPDVVIAEIVWVLASYYKAISYYCEFNLDWVDAYLAAHARENRLKRVEPEFKKIDKKD